MSFLENIFLILEEYQVLLAILLPFIGDSIFFVIGTFSIAENVNGFLIFVIAIFVTICIHVTIFILVRMFKDKFFKYYKKPTKKMERVKNLFLYLRYISKSNDILIVMLIPFFYGSRIITFFYSFFSCLSIKKFIFLITTAITFWSSIFFFIGWSLATSLVTNNSLWYTKYISIAGIFLLGVILFFLYHKVNNGLKSEKFKEYLKQKI